MEVPLYTHAQCMGTANLVQYTLHSMYGNSCHSTNYTCIAPHFTSLASLLLTQTDIHVDTTDCLTSFTHDDLLCGYHVQCVAIVLVQCSYMRVCVLVMEHIL